MQEPTPLSLPSPVTRYVVATRPGFLIATAVPVLIGLAAASLEGTVLWLPATLTLIGALTAHAGINVLNDYYDDKTGCDQINHERVFPYTGGSRVIQNGVLEPNTMAVYGWLLLGFSALTGILLTNWSGPGVLVFGILGFGIGWAYSAPPLRLCARGLGEASVALGFGLLIPLGTTYVQLGHLNSISFWAGLSYAFLIALLLYVNQFPDHRADAATGKKNWVVRLGPYKARAGYPLLVGLAYGSLVTGVTPGPLPAYVLLGLTALPLHLNGARKLWHNAERTGQLKPAILTTLNGTMLQGVLVATGLLLAGLL